MEQVFADGFEKSDEVINEKLHDRYNLKHYVPGSPIIIETRGGNILDGIYRETQANGARIKVDSVSEFPSKSRTSEGRPMYFSAYEIKYLYLFDDNMDLKYVYSEANPALLGISYEEYLKVRDLVWDHKYIPVYDCNFHKTIKEICTCDVIAIVAMGSHSNKIRFAVATFFVIATRNKIYLFDIKYTPKSFWEMGLKNILEDPKIEKVMYDSKSIGDLLFNRYWKIKLTNVFDVMVADYEIRKEEDKEYALNNFTTCSNLIQEYLKLPRGLFKNSELIQTGITHNNRPASDELKRNIAMTVALLIPLRDTQQAILLQNFYSASQAYSDLLVGRSEPCHDAKIKEMDNVVPLEVMKFIEINGKINELNDTEIHS